MPESLTAEARERLGNRVRLEEEPGQKIIMVRVRAESRVFVSPSTSHKSSMPPHNVSSHMFLCSQVFSVLGIPDSQKASAVTNLPASPWTVTANT